MNGETGRQYEALLKRHSDGVVDREFFDDLDVAKRWLFRRWAALPVHVDMVNKYCAAAIYDHCDSRKRIFAMGALRLLE
jgi:hypothetical protein